MLNGIFSRFDALAREHGLEKIKTIGDAYMAAGGLPEPRPDHAAAAAAMALRMPAAVADVTRPLGLDFRVRIGLNTGPVAAGIIGRDKFIYDVWGDTVNVASRMETTGKPGRVHITAETLHALGDRFAVEAREPVDVKGRGPMATFLLTSLTRVNRDESPMPPVRMTRRHMILAIACGAHGGVSWAAPELNPEARDAHRRRSNHRHLAIQGSRNRQTS